MKKGFYFLSILLICSCTSNTILKAPEDLIPKDTMRILLQDMQIATSSQFFKNNNLEKNVNYMAFVFDKYKIDSVRFKASNLYYMSRIDEYKEILENSKKGLETLKKYYEDIRNKQDSLRRDSIKKLKSKKLNIDSLHKIIDKNLKTLDTVAKPNL
ncbi:DUF4296 domain-containing protein [Polaribacter porphyrae]|uniref:DUF4296 domain-containing protein n=1 Tax=Polaribacter porphyrae TaxID=1137780 RepID=A0A2S7WR24_9FLAO|nr:DUF4296 domain-containing protein [Polaribacter porphyrae]PQJ80034.1 hypothetical protein BTO18_13005 [Polaribacter porphyrae]